MHLAHFVQRYPPALGGAESYFRRLSQHFVAMGHTVDVWTTNAFDLAAFWSPTAKCLPAGEEWDGRVRVRRYPLWRMRGRRWLLKPLSLIPQRSWQALTLPCNPISLAMWRNAGKSRVRYDAVHATAFPYAWPILCARRLARRLGVPFLLTPFLHLGDERTRRQYTQPALRKLLLSADRVFVQTELERAAVIDLGVPGERVVLQGLGVDVGECSGGDRRRVRISWSVDDDTVVVGHLANLSVEKGSVDLVRAVDRFGQAHSINGCLGLRLCEAPVNPQGAGQFAGASQSLSPRHPETVNIAGVFAGPAMPNYRAALASWNPSVRLIEPGILTEQQKRDFFAGIDIFALPSRSDSFGLVLLEAWANGVPVVAYDAGGPGELIRHGVDGLLARCGDVEDLARQLRVLIDDPSMRQRLGAAGRARLAHEFAWLDKLRYVSDAMQDAIADNVGGHRTTGAHRSSITSSS